MFFEASSIQKVTTPKIYKTTKNILGVDKVATPKMSTYSSLATSKDV